jgi:DNA-binding CsgD family transcriptional regulator
VSCWILVAADRDEVLAVFDACLAQAGRHGSFLAVAAATLFRSLTWLWRGSLADAETDARESLAGIDAARFDVARPFATAFLADALMELGRLDEAEAVLPAGLPADPVYRTPQWYWMLDSRARLLLAQDRAEDALRAALDCGRRFSSHGWTNPAFLAWRSTAALAAHRLGRTSTALEYALAELGPARRWGAPRALGHALRVVGLVRGADGIAELTEAVTVLAGSPARLEHAKALVDLGTALRATNQLTDARARLTEGLELALRCGATPVVQAAEAELRAAGARVRRHELTGIDALTPSEARVAGLAAEGLSNRDIAQRLFVNVKTVEIHLSSTYRKLGISGRAQLADRMTGTAGPEFVDRHPRPAVPARLGA